MLVLYSGGGREANHSVNEALLRRTGRKATITYIPSQARMSAAYFEDFKQAYAYYGLRRVLWFPLDEGFSERGIREALRRDIIFLSGGNTFYFLRQLRRTKMLPRLREFYRRGGVLMGESAGSIILTPSIGIAGLVPGESDSNELGLKNLHALGLAPFEVYPHFIASRKSVTSLTRYSKNKGSRIFAMRDGSGILVEGSSLQLIGEIELFAGGIRTALL